MQIHNYHQDTLCLILDEPSKFSFLNAMYFQKMSVEEKKTKKKIPFVFQSDTLKIVPAKKDCIIEIHYYYQPDYFMMNDQSIFCPYQQSWFSWYFSIPNMKINNVTVSVPEDLYFFSNLMQKKKEKKKVYLSTDNIPERGISFFWVEKRFYEQVKTSIGTTQHNLYLFKDVVFTGDSSDHQKAYLPLQRINKSMIDMRISELNKAVQGIEKVFQKRVSFDVVEACLDIGNGEAAVRWGSEFLLSENQSFIFMDTAFWNDHCFTHEMVHAYNDILPSKTDSSYYFFNESMTEYFAIYFRYNKQEKDSAYEAKILKYINLKQEYISVFEINKSSLGFDLGGTYGVVYLKAPFVIDRFAKRIGEDKFFEILFCFYRQIRETKTVNFFEFEKVFKSKGVSNEDWDWFVKNL